VTTGVHLNSRLPQAVLWMGAAFEKRFGKTPDNFATWSYDATKVLVEAIDSTGGGKKHVTSALKKRE